MKLSKKQLRRIIRGVIAEGLHAPNETILDLAAQPGGVHIDRLVKIFGNEIFHEIDELQADGLIYMEDDGTVISLRGY